MSKGDKGRSVLAIEVRSLKKRFKDQIRFMEDDKSRAGADMERRLQGMNDLRKQLDNQANTFTTRLEHDALKECVNRLDIWRATQEGKMSRSVLISTLALILAAVLALLRFLQQGTP